MNAFATTNAIAKVRPTKINPFKKPPKLSPPRVKVPKAKLLSTNEFAPKMKIGAKNNERVIKAWRPTAKGY